MVTSDGASGGGQEGEEEEQPMADQKNAPIPVNKVSRDRETIGDFRSKSELGPTHVALWEYDWTHSADEEKPKHDLGKSHESGYKRRIFVHSQGVEVGGYKRGSERAYTELYVKDQAQHFLEQAQVTQKTFSGTSNVITFRTGGKFALTPEPETKYLATQTRHFGTFPKAGHREDLQQPEEGVGREGYRNSFECIPLTVPYRLQEPIPRPRIEGSVLATVVGPSSQDVHTDPHGRVRIRFHWDRKSKKLDSKRLCWARVSQAWAGKGFGTMFIPRIGMEVIVQFIEGDPDRPIVMGCVYNDVNYPPLTLEDDQTKSILCTRSSPQEEGKPAGFNSIEFEDMADQELLSIHAQRDMKEIVLHDHTANVMNDETLEIENDQQMTVKGNRTKAIEKNEEITVKGNRSTTVSKNESFTVEGSRSASVAGTDSLAVEKDRDVAIKGNLSCSIEKDELRSISKSRSTSIEGEDILKIKKMLQVKADEAIQLAQGSTSLSFSQNKVNLDAGGAVTNTQGSVTVTIKDGKLNIKASEGVTIERGGSTVRVESSSIGIKGSKVKIG
jgi:type VI secretion system secreted protein VgrG